MEKWKASKCTIFCFFYLTFSTGVRFSSLSPLYSGQPINSTFTNSECCISSGSTQFVKVKKIFRQKTTIFFENYNQTPLDMYNGLSQVYCIKLEERGKSILVYTGLSEAFFCKDVKKNNPNFTTFLRFAYLEKNILLK